MISFFLIVCLATALCLPAEAQAAKVLFFEAALAPSDMIFSTEPAGFSELAEVVRSEGMRLASMSAGEITREKLRPYEIVVLHCSPERPLQNKEISALVWFVAQDGGTLFVNGGTGRVINPLTEIFGISMDATELIDSSSAMEGDSQGHKFLITDFPANTGMQIEGINTIGFYGGAPLELSQDASAVARGGENCYSADGFYSIGSFPPVAAVAYLGPGVVLVKSDRAMLNNQNIGQYENKTWAKAVFAQLAAARGSSVERNQSILGLRSRILNLEATLQNAAEKIAKNESDLTLGYKKLKDTEAKLQSADKKSEELGLQLNNAQAERDTLQNTLSWYQSSDIRKKIAIAAAAALLIAIFFGFWFGRWSLRPKKL